jgi:hypothetical protein
MAGDIISGQRQARRAAAALIVLLLCVTAPVVAQAQPGKPGDNAAPPPGAPLRVTEGVGRTLEVVVPHPGLLGFVNLIASNWELQQQVLASDLLSIQLRRRGMLAGGEGEAAQLFARHAQAWARQQGFAGYTVLEYSEGIAHAFPFPERVAQGVIRLERPR